MVSRRGFALVDGIVAGVLLGTGLAVIIGLAGRALASQRLGAELHKAAMLADEQLNLVLAMGPERFGSAFDARGRYEAPFADFSYEVTVRPGEGSRPYIVEAIIRRQRDNGVLARVQTLISQPAGEDPDPDRKPQQTIERVR
ncbi:MAG: hypothetical protein EA380_03140 [Phycisphaeraceae bacterium]|nr:MAG: hypothetical protein EA380_03140 [Phycisphaeraceae bacterium]